MRLIPDWFFFQTEWKGELRFVAVTRDLVENALGTDATAEDMAAWVQTKAEDLAGFLRFDRRELSPEGFLLLRAREFPTSGILDWLDSRDIGW